jgi:hypothetical protein
MPSKPNGVWIDAGFILIADGACDCAGLFTYRARRCEQKNLDRA